MKPTFKQFLAEGGAATADHNTGRATKADIEAALAFVSKHTGIKQSELIPNLLGSTGHTLAGRKKDSGDIDIAFEEGKYDRDLLVDRMKKVTGMDKVHQTGSGTYSFAVPGAGDNKVQVDFMFVPSEKWARFGFHSALDSAYKGLVRNNYLLDNVMKHTFEPGKDITVKDAEGNEIVRVRRTFGRGEGVYRTFKVAPMRKDGKGRVQLRKGTPDEVEAQLKSIGHSGKFSKDVDAILDPDMAASFLFGKGTKAADLMSAEQVIKAIFKRKDHAAIFKDVVADLKQAELPVPAEIAKFA
jgi:hypothetical protein